MSVTDRATKRITRVAGAVEGAGASWSKLGGMMRGVGMAMTMVGAMMFAFVDQMKQEFVKMEAPFARVIALTGRTGDEIQEMMTLVQRVGENTSTTLDKVAESMYFVASAGITSAQAIEDTATAALQLAHIHGTDATQATEMLLTVTKGMGMEMAQVTDVANIMSAAISKSLIKIDSLQDTMKFAVPVAGALGISLEALTAGVMDMANAGIKGSKSGTALRTGLIRLAAPTAEARDIMRRLGIELFNLPDDARNTREQMNELGDSMARNADEISEVEIKIKALRDAMRDYSIVEKEASLIVRKMRFRANVESRDLFDDETERIDRLSTFIEGQAINRETLALQEMKENRVLDNLNVTRDEAIVAEEELNDAFLGQKGTMIDLDKVMVELTRGLQGLSEGQRIAALDALVGKRAIAGFLAMLSPLNQSIGGVNAQLINYSAEQVEAIALTGEMGSNITTNTQMLQEQTGAISTHDQMWQSFTGTARVYLRTQELINDRMNSYGANLTSTQNAMMSFMDTVEGAKNSIVGMVLELAKSAPWLISFISLFTVLGPLVMGFGMLMFGVSGILKAHAGIQAFQAGISVKQAATTELLSAANMKQGVTWKALMADQIAHTKVQKLSTMGMGRMAMMAGTAAVGIMATMEAMSSGRPEYVALSAVTWGLFAAQMALAMGITAVRAAMWGIAAGVVVAAVLIALAAMKKGFDDVTNSVMHSADAVEEAYANSIVPDALKSGARHMAKPLTMMQEGFMALTDSTMMATESVNELGNAVSQLRGNRVGIGADIGESGIEDLAGAGAAGEGAGQEQTGARIGEINVNVTTGPITGVADIEAIGDIIGDQIIDKIERRR